MTKGRQMGWLKEKPMGKKTGWPMGKPTEKPMGWPTEKRRLKEQVCRRWRARVRVAEWDKQGD